MAGSHRITRRVWPATLLGVVVLLLSLAACLTPKGTGVPGDAMLLDVSAFPDGWTLESEPHSARDMPAVLRDQNALDFSTVGFAAPGSTEARTITAGQIIWDFGNPLRATIEFYTRFRPEREATREPLGEWSYRLENADRFRFYCLPGNLAYHDTTAPWFVAVAQYGRYITTFTGPLGPRYLTTDDLPRILGAMDARVAACMRDPDSAACNPTATEE